MKTEDAERRMVVSTLRTQIDYGSLTSDLFHGHKFHTGFTWDEKGVRYIIDSWKDAGVSLWTQTARKNHALTSAATCAVCVRPLVTEALLRYSTAWIRVAEKARGGVQ